MAAVVVAVTLRGPKPNGEILIRFSRSGEGASRNRMRCGYSERSVALTASADCARLSAQGGGMTAHKLGFGGLMLCVRLVWSAAAWAQLSEAARSAVLISTNYDVLPNITYGIANNYELKLDVYRPTTAKAPTPVVMMIHGGGWVRHEKEEEVLSLLPYLEMGWAAVNVEYRLARVSLAPAAVEDCRCALHWIGRNAAKYNFDIGKVVVTGASAGGHLALTTAMIPSSAGFDNRCVSQDDSKWSGPWPDITPNVAAVINWVGATDVDDLLHGPNIRSWAVSWLGSQADRKELAKRVSPISYVRAGLPP